MKTNVTIVSLLGTGFLLIYGCVSKTTYLRETQRGAELKAQSESQASQIQSLRSQTQTLQTQVQARTADFQAAQAQNTELMQTLEAKKGELNQRLAEAIRQNQDLEQKIRDIEQAKTAELAEFKASYEQLVNGLKSELQSGHVTITQLKGRLSVTMVDKILFDSGEARIKPEGLQVLDRVGDVLKQLEDKDIRIEGYTDNVPIKRSLQDKFPTNWELSTARATAVVRYFQEKVGIHPDRLIAVGYGETHPIASNKIPEGRQENRRIEIVLVPVEQPRYQEISAPPLPVKEGSNALEGRK